MITMTPSSTPPVNMIADLLERFMDPKGTADRSARFAAVLAEAIAMIDRVAELLATELVREMAALKRALEKLSDEVQTTTATSEQARAEIDKRLKILRTIL